MPSRSPKQHRLMEAVAHDKKFAKQVGIPQKVGREYVQADMGSMGETKKAKGQSHHGRVLYPKR